MSDPKLQSYQEHQKRFIEHVKHLESLDPQLELFARDHGFELEKNQWHRPCRVLRRKGNPEQIIDISQDGDWKCLLFSHHLPHTVSVIAQAMDAGAEHNYRLSNRIADSVHFSIIQRDLQDLLAAALSVIQRWPLPVVLTEGEKVAHPATSYRRKSG